MVHLEERDEPARDVLASQHENRDAVQRVAVGHEVDVAWDLRDRTGGSPALGVRREAGRQLDSGQRPVVADALAHEREVAHVTSSQSLATTHGSMSLPAVTVQTSVKSAPQPPSAFIARNSACIRGRSEPAPVQ